MLAAAATTLPPMTARRRSGRAAALIRGMAVAALVGLSSPATAQDAPADPGANGSPQGGAAEAAAPDMAGSDAPVISSEDSGIGAAVMEGPSEPASAFVGWDAPAEAAPPSAPEAGAADLAEAPSTEASSSGAAAPAPAPGAPPPAMARAQPPAASGADAQKQGAPDAPMPAMPVVVELFTSQGCSSCPPADGLLAELAGRPDVLSLSFHVDYWDYLGWQDQFARPEFTARQQAYGRVSGERAIYTPQIVVGGVDTLIDAGPASLEALIDAHAAEAGPVAVSLNRAEGRVTIELWPGTVATGPVSVDLVRYLPSREVRIGAGENRGRILAYRNIVVSVERLAQWDGRAPLRLTVQPGAGSPQALPGDTRHAVLVQQRARARGLGPILAAVPID